MWNNKRKDPTAQYQSIKDIRPNPSNTDFMIYVGPQATAVNAHRAVLARNSGYFKRICLNKNCKECQQGFVNLPDVKDEALFKTVHKFLYTGQFNPKPLPLSSLLRLLQLSDYLEVLPLLSLVWSSIMRILLPYTVTTAERIVNSNSTTLTDTLVWLFERREILGEEKLQELLDILVDYRYTDEIVCNEAMVRVLREDNELAVKVVRIMAGKMRSMHDREAEICGSGFGRVGEGFMARDWN